jgi:glycosyltransferase involved in cell wall biosynthesis
MSTLSQVSRPLRGAGPTPNVARPAIRVVQVSTTDERGGAARAALRLHRELRASGVTSRMVVAQRFGADPEVAEYNPFSPGPAVLGRAFFRLGRRLHRPSFNKVGGFFSSDWGVSGRHLASSLPETDVVNLHWVSDLLDYRSLPSLAARHPIVWTFHDMNAFTGGCHYSGLCERFVARCGSCPQLITATQEDDMTRRVLERKREVLRRVPPERLTVVSPSAWLARETRRSALFGHFDVHVIPNGIDVQEFHPMPQTEARARLNLPAEARMVLFVAEQVVDRRKGLRLLLKAFQQLRSIPSLRLVTLGRGGREAIADDRVIHLGSLDDSERLRAAYSAADVFAMPSLQDNLPNTIIEAMACGTPVAGFAAGGVGEAVIHGESGLLARTGDYTALAGALREILEDRDLRAKLSRNARERGKNEYAIERQAQRYAALYRELMERSAGAGAGRASKPGGMPDLA